MKVACWNVNSVRARLSHLLRWLKEFRPDALMLQELKCRDEEFPAAEIEELGYNTAVFGQKGYNGVAILAKSPLEDVVRLQTEGDEQSRQLEAVVRFGERALRLVSVYVPNGNPINSPKFEYKLRWLDGFLLRVEEMMKREELFVIGGDYNAITDERDAHNPENWDNDALGHPQTKQRICKLLGSGLVDALRVYHTGHGNYSYWDYQRGAFAKNEGLLLDRLLLSPRAADCLVASDVDRFPRGWERASDHAPVWCELRPRLELQARLRRVKAEVRRN